MILLYTKKDTKYMMAPHNNYKRNVNNVSVKMSQVEIDNIFRIGSLNTDGEWIGWVEGKSYQASCRGRWRRPA